MMDFHTHILPHIDDGSKSVEQSLEMLRMLKQQGVKTVVLTPHYYPDEQNIDDFLKSRDKQYRMLCAAIKGEDYPQLRLGAEVMLSLELINMKGIDRLCIEGTDYLLLEMPWTATWSVNYMNCINQILAEYNVVPVLAHIDRYFKVLKPRQMRDLLDMEVLAQCNAGSIISFKTRWKVLRMIRRGEIHFIGSDCHNLSSRKPNIDKAMKVLKRFSPFGFEQFTRDVL